MRRWYMWNCLRTCCWRLKNVQIYGLNLALHPLNISRIKFWCDLKTSLDQMITLDSEMRCTICLYLLSKAAQCRKKGICKISLLMVQLSISDFQPGFVIFSAPVLVKAWNVLSQYRCLFVFHALNLCTFFLLLLRYHISVDVVHWLLVSCVYLLTILNKFCLYLIPKRDAWAVLGNA